MATMNVSVPDEMKEWVEAQVKTGRYAGASDVIRDAVRKAQQQEAAKLAFIEEIERGRQSGISKATSAGEIFETVMKGSGVDDAA
ncbi:MAG: type II toxin-antitoxin system ParD family antitoxin [Pseudomonadota bacterium]